MSGDDLLGAGTGTTVVSQRSEAGLDQEYCTKAGIGKYDMLYDVVCEAVMSSCMSAGCLTERRDMVPYLAITAKSEFSWYSPFLAYVFFF